MGGIETSTRDDGAVVVSNALKTISATELYTERYAYNSSNMVEYVGKAVEGSAEDSAVWQIFKLIYDGTNVTQKLWASGTTSFTKKWTERESYSYS